MSDDNVNGTTGHEDATARLPVTLPSAETVMAYERTVPGASERILNMTERAFEHTIRMAEEEGAHRRTLERRRHVRGMFALVFGFIVALLAVLFGCCIAYLQDPLIGTIITLGVPAILIAGWVLASPKAAAAARRNR